MRNGNFCSFEELTRLLSQDSTQRAYNYLTKFPHLSKLRVNAQKSSILQEFCLRQDATVEQIAFIVSMNVDAVDEPNVEGYLALHMSASVGNLDVCRLLVRVSPMSILHPANNGRIPLHFAAQNNHLEIVRYFLGENRELAKCRGTDGRLPMHLAASNDNLELVTELFNAYPDAVASATFDGNYTPAFVACSSKHLEMVKLLLSWDSSALDVFDSLGRNCLTVAISNGNMDVAHWLVQNFEHLVDLINPLTAMTSLHYAVLSGSLESVELVVIARPNLVASVCSQGYTCFHLAAQENNWEIFHYLRQMNPQPMTAISNTGRSCLHFVCQNPHGDVRMLQLLIRTESNLASQISTEGFSCLHLALFYGNIPASELLLSKHPSLSFIKTSTDNFPLHSLFLGIAPHELSLAQRLIDSNPFAASTPNGNGCTPLALYGQLLLNLSHPLKLTDSFTTETVIRLLEPLYISSPTLEIFRRLVAAAVHVSTAGHPSNPSLELVYWQEIHHFLNWKFRWVAFVLLGVDNFRISTSSIGLNCSSTLVISYYLENIKASGSRDFVRRSTVINLLLFRKLYVDHNDTWRHIVKFL